MASYLADEQIPLRVVAVLKESGVAIRHVKFDYNKGSISDEAVNSLGKKEKLTVVTNNTKDFTKLPPTEIKTSWGIWCINTPSPDEQIRIIKYLDKEPGLRTKHFRKGKLVQAGETEYTITDYTSGKIERLKY